MAEHRHTTFVAGCYRCEQGRDEALDAAVAERDELRALVERVAASGVVFEDPRVGYVEVQIDRETWEALKDA